MRHDQMPMLFDAQKYATALRVRMAELRISSKEAAEAIGCSPSTISRICNGKSPDVENYLRINRWLADTQPQEAE